MGGFGRSGFVRILNDRYGRSGLPEYVVEGYPKVVSQPILYVIQSTRPDDVQLFLQSVEKKLQIELLTVDMKSVKARERDFYKIFGQIEEGKSVAVNANNLLAYELRELVIGVVERGGKELVIQIKGHWLPEPYNIIEYDTAEKSETFLKLLRKKLKSIKT